MALINCPECKKDISNKAKLCPQCGYDVSKHNRKVWIMRNKRKILTCAMILVILCCCLIGGYRVYEHFDKQEKLRKDSVYNSLRTKYNELNLAVNILKREKDKTENNESKVSQNVDIMLSKVNEIDDILKAESSDDVKRKFFEHIHNISDETFSWEDYKENVLRGECFLDDDKANTIKRIIDYKMTKAERNYDKITIGMDQQEAIKMMGNDYSISYGKERVYTWNEKYMLVFEDGVVIDKRIEE